MIGGRLKPRQVDVLLEVLVVVLVTTGVASLLVGTAWSRLFTALHGVAGLGVVVLSPAKARGSVATGLRRHHRTRWLSLVLALLVAAAVVLGVAHSTGVWYGIGYWSPLWTHMLVALLLLAIFGWHVVSRPNRPTMADLDRRALLGGGLALAVAAVSYGTQEVAVRAFGLAGGRRRFTGSHEVGSFDPVELPTVSWINDTAPASTEEDGWRLDVAGREMSIAELRDVARPLVATLDCTGGWWSVQSWDAVPLSRLLGDGRGRSIEVTSTTGYSRLFPRRDADRLHLAVGYGGEPLRRGHGAPVRLVAPGRRGLWWIKWVTSVQLDDRPWWWQTPFPLE